MSGEEDSNRDSKAGARIVGATRYRAGVRVEKFPIYASTKHGKTALISVKPPQTLQAGETLVTEGFIFGARNFAVVGEHAKAMKMPGTWYEVRVTASMATANKRKK